MIDQRVSEGIKSNLFGTPAFTTTIPAQIVKKYNCEIVLFTLKDTIKLTNLVIDRPIQFDKELNIEDNI